MSISRRALETAVRRTLAFHLGGQGARGEKGVASGGTEERELLVSALLDAAETGALRTVADVGGEFDDYFPDADLSSSGKEELYDDLLRYE